MAEGVEDAGESEGRPVMERIGPREREYPARKGADFRHGLNGRETLERLELPEMLDGANRTDR